MWICGYVYHSHASFHIGLNHKIGNSHIASLPSSSVKGSEFVFNLSKQQNYCLTLSPVFGKTAAERRHPDCVRISSICLLDSLCLIMHLLDVNTMEPLSKLLHLRTEKKVYSITQCNKKDCNPCKDIHTFHPLGTRNVTTLLWIESVNKWFCTTPNS